MPVRLSGPDVIMRFYYAASVRDEGDQTTFFEVPNCPGLLVKPV